MTERRGRIAVLVVGATIDGVLAPPWTIFARYTQGAADVMVVFLSLSTLAIAPRRDVEAVG